MIDQTEFQSVVINGTKLIARRFVLESLVKAHNELVSLGIGANGKLGFVAAPERTASWRSEVLQRQLLNQGASKTMYSNHRCGTAIDCFANWNYIKAISPIMKKHGLINDLAYVSKDWKVIDDSYDAITSIPWDGGHYNWGSNAIARSYKIVNSLPSLIKEFSMNEFENHLVQLNAPGTPGSGAFALVVDGKRHEINTKDTGSVGRATFTIFMRGMPSAPLTKDQWDAIPAGDTF